jgi:hypothetical protein
MRARTTGTISIAGGTSESFTYNEDLLMASFFHPTWGSSTKVNDGTKWCSEFKITLPADGTAATATAT